MSNESDDYDNPWKEAINHFFPEFLAFYFPNAYQQIDWTKPYTFLDQELAQIVGDSEIGKRRVDCLVEVATFTSGSQWIYIHIKVQSQFDVNFTERLFIYNYRLYDRYQRPISTLVIFADERKNWQPTVYESSELFGTKIIMHFASIKLLNYLSQLEELLENPNPFALVTAAHLLTKKTKRNSEARYAAKWQLTKLLYERNWNREQILDLFRVIDWLMRLPTDLEKQLLTSISTLERNLQMPYVTSVERIGIEQGRQQGEAVFLQRLLVKRFGRLSESIEARLAQATIAELELWGDRILEAQTLDEVFG